MITKCTPLACSRSLVCVDSYDSGVLKGRFFSPHQEMERFDSLSQFLLRVEQQLDDLQYLRDYAQARTLSDLMDLEEEEPAASCRRQGNRGTFELQVLYRQHNSWQGFLHWREQDAEQSFRSVLELVRLLDNALGGPERRDAV